MQRQRHRGLDQRMRYGWAIGGSDERAQRVPHRRHLDPDLPRPTGVRAGPSGGAGEMEDTKAERDAAVAENARLAAAVAENAAALAAVGGSWNVSANWGRASGWSSSPWASGVRDGLVGACRAERRTAESMCPRLPVALGPGAAPRVRASAFGPKVQLCLSWPWCLRVDVPWNTGKRGHMLGATRRSGGLGLTKACRTPVSGGAPPGRPMRRRALNESASSGHSASQSWYCVRYPSMQA